MIKLLLLVLILSWGNVWCASYQIGIYTDEPSHQKALGLVEYFKNTEPFRRLDINFNIFNCKSENGIDRLIVCDSKLVSAVAAKSGMDQAFVVTNNPKYGGSGGSVPVITTSAETPYSMMIHEYLHTLGFGDEYAYSASEAEIYCKRSLFYINLAIIEPQPQGYSGGDAEARKIHSKDIPWYTVIQPTTWIASNRLGTPGNDTNRVGLFPAQTCRKKAKPMTLWRPGSHTNVMEDLDQPLNELAPIVQATLASAGYTIKTEVGCEPTTEGQPLPPPILRNFKVNYPTYINY